MRIWSLIHVRNPLWRALGIGTILAVGLASVYLAYLRPSPLAPGKTVVPFSQGKVGKYIEQLGNGRFTLEYEKFQGDKDLLKLEGVNASLEEPKILWHMRSPYGEKKDEAWTLHGPMTFDALDLSTGKGKGKGQIQDSGPALGWEKGLWRGLAPLAWEDLEEGPSKGIWHLPAGWRRELDGRFLVENGLVTWKSTTKEGQVKTMKATNVWTVLGLTEGRMENVEAEVQDGKVTAQSAVVDPKKVDWFAPIKFVRNDGWIGEAGHGVVYRPPGGRPVEIIELKTFRAHRFVGQTAEKKVAENNVESLRAQGVRWTPAGLRLEGDVTWEQPMEGSRLMLKSPRVLIREAPGQDLPKELPVGEAWAEGSPVLTWDKKSLTSPRMEVRRSDRTWRIQAPVHGRGLQGTFSAGAGHGTKDVWEFEGPIRANMIGAGNLRGDKLLWETETWTILGRPATLIGTRERLSGDMVTGKGDLVSFPRGLSGAFQQADGELVVRADRGDLRERAGIAKLQGRVECKGRLWRLNADDVVVELGAGKTIKRLIAKGSVFLKGNMGQGWGESLELDLTDVRDPKVRWDGKVRGVADVKGE